MQVSSICKSSFMKPAAVAKERFRLKVIDKVGCGGQLVCTVYFSGVRFGKKYSNSAHARDAIVRVNGHKYTTANPIRLTKGIH